MEESQEQEGFGQPTALTSRSTVVDLFAAGGPITLIDADGARRTVDASALDEAARRLVGGFSSIGLGPGDRIGCHLPNGFAYLTTLLACARLGAVAVAVNTRYRSGEIGDIVHRSGCRALIVEPEFAGTDTTGILDRIDPALLVGLETIVTVGPADLDPSAPIRRVDSRSSMRVVRFEDLASSPPSDVDHASRDAPFAVFTTSGTTSAPKLVLHRQSSVVDHALDVAAGCDLGPDDTTLVALPFCGVFGFVALTTSLAGGSEQVVCSLFDAPTAVAAVSDLGVTTMLATDDMVHRMLEALETGPGGQDLSSIRYTGYARFNNALEGLAERADAVGWPLIGLYGMSEVQAFYSWRPPQLPLDERIVPGGEAVSPDADVRVVDPDTGEPLGVGVEGELQLKGPSSFAGYLAPGGELVDEELTAAHFTDDGWFRTGDLARWEGGRRFEYLARMGDVLRLGGFLVAPAEIEANLLDVDPVEAVQVVAVDTERGPRVVAFVTLEAGASVAFDETAAIEHCRLRLAAFKVPVRVIELDEFPVTDSANGLKIQKVRLRELAEEAFAGRDGH